MGVDFELLAWHTASNVAGDISVHSWPPKVACNSEICVPFARVARAGEVVMKAQNFMSEGFNQGHIEAVLIIGKAI